MARRPYVRAYSGDNLRRIQELPQLTYGDCCMDRFRRPTYPKAAL
jgi:hypothetical protein